MFSPSTTQNQAPRRCTFDAFGTVVSFKAFLSDAEFDAASTLVREEGRRYERLFSAFDPRSDVGRMNAAQGEWTVVSRDTFDLLEMSIGYCERSGGVFDVTVKPLVDLWDVHRGIVPEPEAIEEALAHVDYRMIELESGNGICSARLADPAGAIDLGGTAKGFIADRLCETLISQGVGSFILSLGGNVAARGTKPDGRPFVVGVRDPNDHRRVVGTLELRDASAVASGVTERYFERDGTSYSHIIDPRSGYPIVTDLKLAMVVARKSADCDGFSTTICMLGSEEGARFFEGEDCLDMAVLVSAVGTVDTCWRRGAKLLGS